MTKQFKKDCVTLCKHFEEARVTRGAAGLTRKGIGSERLPKELPPLLPAVHPPGCRCLRMMPGEMPQWHRIQEKQGSLWSRSWKRLFRYCSCCVRCCQKSPAHNLESRRLRGTRGQKTDPYQYQFAEIKQRKQTRASSISSENFCSSRSSSWRNGAASGSQNLGHGHAHTCNIPLKLMDPNRRRHSAWLITRKTSQDSNLSSSRNDSSASATTASTSTFRLSRSSGGSSTPLPAIITHSNKTQPHQFTSTLPKPRLVRQEAVQEEDDSSPPRLGVRFLPTIPSAADSSVIMEDGDSGLNPALNSLYNALQANKILSPGSGTSHCNSTPTTPTVTTPSTPPSAMLPSKDHQPP